MAESSEAVNAGSNSAEQQEAPVVSSSSVEQPACAQCKKNDKPLKDCIKCHSVSYCSKDCQKAHFKVHKKVCASLAQEYTKTHEPKMASRAPPKAGDRAGGLQKWQFDT